MFKPSWVRNGEMLTSFFCWNCHKTGKFTRKQKLSGFSVEKTGVKQNKLHFLGCSDCRFSMLLLCGKKFDVEIFWNSAGWNQDHSFQEQRAKGAGWGLQFPLGNQELPQNSRMGWAQDGDAQYWIQHSSPREISAPWWMLRVDLIPGVFHVSNIQEIPQLQLRRNHTERQRELKNWEFTWNTENTSVIPFNFMLRCEEKTWGKNNN